MNTTLEKELTLLSPQEKAEVIEFLLPAVVGNGDEIAPDLLAELERRDDAYETNPSGAMTLREFDRKWFGQK